MTEEYENYDDNEEETFEDQLENLSDEEIENNPEKAEKIAEAYIAFSENFSQYIKGIDKELWRRAVDYAKSCAEEDVDGVSFRYSEDNNEEE